MSKLVRFIDTYNFIHNLILIIGKKSFLWANFVKNYLF